MGFGKMGAVGGFGSFSSLGGVNNPPWPIWNAGKARVRNGTGRTKIFMPGDSTFTGVGAGTGAILLDGARPLAVPRKLAAYLTTSGLTAFEESFTGLNYSAGTIAQYLTYNTLVALPTSADWSVGTAIPGGPGFVEANTATSSLQISANEQWDTCELYYLRGTSLGTFTVNVDGGATLASVPSLGSFNFLKTTISTTLGTHVLNLQRSSGGTVQPGATVLYNSAVPAVDVINGGIAGANSANYASTTQAWSPLSGISVMAPDLVIINLGINDSLQGVTAATFLANMSAIITAIKAYADVLYIIPNPISAPVTDLYATHYQLVRTFNLRVLDIVKLFGGSYAAANASGYMANTVHPNAAGYALIAQTLAAKLLQN